MSFTLKYYDESPTPPLDQICQRRRDNIFMLFARPGLSTFDEFSRCQPFSALHCDNAEDVFAFIDTPRFSLAFPRSADFLMKLFFFFFTD
jgi:hypothetical protein